eukprot:1158786-Pelagomonas_calceolata.AAC.6
MLAWQSAHHPQQPTPLATRRLHWVPSGIMLGRHKVHHLHQHHWLPGACTSGRVGIARTALGAPPASTPLATRRLH